MIPPDSPLYIYEIQGMLPADLPHAPASFIGTWNEEGFSYLFFTDIADDYVRGAVCPDGLTYASRHEMTYRDWQTGLPPHGIIIEGIAFVPTDHPAPPRGSVLLDPSVVFGDGNHPTTVSCIRLMANIVMGHRIDSVLDLGTGTGILGLAAAAMGVRRVVAVDKNTLAVKTARENVKRNSFGAAMEVHEGEARLFIDKPFDLVVANLPFRVLRDMLIMRDMACHKFWIISGIDERQAMALQELLEEQGYDLGARAVDHPWVTFTMADNDRKGRR